MMLRRTFIQLPAVLVAAGGPPEIYGGVAGLVWVVKDAGAVAAKWGRVGVPVAGEPVRLDFTDAVVRGKKEPTAINVVSGNFGSMDAHWVEPVGQTGPFAEFLKLNKGDGVMALLHAAPTRESYEAELKRLKGIYPVLIEASFDGGGGEMVRFAMFDTKAEGLYSLGLIYPRGQSAGQAPPERRVTQYAWVTKTPQKVSVFWEKAGLPAFTYTMVNGRDAVYRGKPGEFDMRLGWQRHGKVPYEWIEPLKGPSCYHEQLDAHGEGFHHLAFNVQDMDKAIAEWKSLGYELAMGGAWGEKDKPGSGRYAYFDTRAAGGIYVELLWNYRQAG